MIEMMTQKISPLPDDWLNEMESLMAYTSSANMEFGWRYWEMWRDIGHAKTHEFMEVFQIDDYEKAERKARSWFTSSVAGSCAITTSAVRHRYLVTEHVTRDLATEHQAFNYSQWRAMLAGDKDKEENLKENMEWAYDYMEEHGHFPKPETISAHINGTNNLDPWDKWATQSLAKLDKITTSEAPPQLKGWANRAYGDDDVRAWREKYEQD